MSAQESSGYGSGNYSGWAVGWITFAGVTMIMVGIFQALNGIVGIVNDDFFVKTHHYTYSLSTTSWGWIHLILGIIVVISGIGLFTGNLAARIVAVTIAMLSTIANFLWLPYYPVWSVVIIAFNIAIIWALTAHGGDIATNA
jgi:hypothetical protein